MDDTTSTSLDNLEKFEGKVAIITGLLINLSFRLKVIN